MREKGSKIANEIVLEYKKEKEWKEKRERIKQLEEEKKKQTKSN